MTTASAAQAPLRLAIIGAGISGLVAAYVLSRRHQITVFEASPRVGGHTNTISVEREGTHDVDTGFIVFNRQNYPNFMRLLGQLDVATQPTDMSFSVQCARTGLEYRGSSFGTFFAQRRNLFRWRHWRLLREILRFNREAPRLLDEQETDLTLGAWLEERRYGPALAEHYLVPMSAALWSADPGHALEFPAHYFVRFFENHGFFRLEGRPEWLVIRGGSQRYVDRLVRAFEDRIRTATPVRGIRRFEDRVQIEVEGGGAEAFDAVVLAVHSDQALQMLEDPSQAEREVLGAIPYQRNEAILHTDPSVMPHCRRAWSSWNYHVPESATGQATVTYHMNRLQSLPDDPPFFVTLNREDAVDSESVLRRITYHHPVYTPRSRAAQLGHVRISGVRNTWYCGAYWGWGFHEDGVRSALDVCADFGLNL